MFMNFPNYSVSYFGILLIIIGYFKLKIYSFIMTFIWIGIIIEIIYDISRIIYRFFKKLSSETSDTDVDNSESVDSENIEHEEAIEMLTI